MSLTNLRKRINRSHTTTMLFSGCAMFLVASVIVYPEEAFKASLKGLSIWWEVLLPAQLPFFIIAELLIGFGVVHFLGVLLEPFMRPIFRVPGSGSFVMAVGLTSGNPIGAKLTSRLREQGLISRTEGERLVSFTSTAGPLFMFGTVAVGFFHDAKVGIILASVHYLSNFLVGFLMRFHEPDGPTTPAIQSGKGFILVRALRAMHRARIGDGRTLGQLLSDAVVSSVNTCLMIGGFLVFFSVMISMLTIIHLTDWLASFMAALLHLIGLPAILGQGIVPGLLEITLGAQAISVMPSHVPLRYQLAACNAIIAWSGLSIHAQVASLLSRTDIRYLPYLLARVLHGMLAFLLTLALWDPLEKQLSRMLIIPAFLHLSPQSGWGLWWMYLIGLGWLAFISLLVMGCCSFLIHWFRRAKP